MTLPEFLKPCVAPIRALPLAAALLAILLIANIAGHTSAVQNGREIVVEARGYDPREILLGHYVQITPQLEIDNQPFDTGPIDPDNPPPWSISYDDGWATLREGDGLWSLETIARDRPTDLADNQIAIQADVWANRVSGSDLATYDLSASININRIYANQREARDIEDALRGRGDDDRSVELILSITPDGKPLVKGIVLDGNRQIFGWW